MKKLIEMIQVFAKANPWLVMGLSLLPITLLIGLFAVIPVAKMVGSISSESVQEGIWAIMVLLTYAFSVPWIWGFLNLKKIRIDPCLRSWFPSIQRHEDWLRSGNIA